MLYSHDISLLRMGCGNPIGEYVNKFAQSKSIKFSRLM